MKKFTVKFNKNGNQVTKTHKLSTDNQFENILGGYYVDYLHKKIDNLIITNHTDNIHYDYDNEPGLRRKG